MVKKLKYAMTAPTTVIPFAREVAIDKGNCSNRANHAAKAVAAMRIGLALSLATPNIKGLQANSVDLQEKLP
jgi:hypothetical protein